MAKKNAGVNPTDVSAFLLLGGIGGVVFDMFYASTGLPGFDDELPSCQRLKFGDIIQIGLESLVLLGSLYTKSDKLRSFASGLLFGGLIPKLSALNGPRYILFDLDPATGAIMPVGRLTGENSIAEDVGEYFEPGMEEGVSEEDYEEELQQ